jgi:ribosomal protein S18 acetylase RimI-like enzyme
MEPSLTAPSAAPTTPITVREAVPEEYDEAGRLMVEAYEQYRPVFPSEFWDGYNDELRDVTTRAERAVILVAEEAGTIVGTLALYPPGDVKSHWPQDWTGVRVLAVSPQHRRKGIARILMDESIRRARAWGSPVLALNTAGYMTPAVGLYEALGFRRLPEHEHLMASGTLLRAYGIELVPGALASPDGLPA